MSKNLSKLSQRQGIKNDLFSKIVDANTPKTNDDKPVDKKALANEFLVGESTIEGSASFYDLTNEAAKKIKIRVCNGSSCLCAGTQEAVTEKLKGHFSKDEISHITCLGRCHENNAFYYQGKNYSGKAIDNIESILHSETDQSADSYTVNSYTVDSYTVDSLTKNNVLTASIDSIEALYQPLIDAIKLSASDDSIPKKLLQQVIDCKVRGRGGAGFPTGIKWQSCAQQDANEKYIICNADEGDPGAYSDRYLLEYQPHRVLFGMLLAGFTTGAQWGILYIRAEYPESITRIQNAIDELYKLGFVGSNIRGSVFNFDIKIIEGAGAYICGEETALIRSIEGQRPVVSVRPPFPTVAGLYNCPTVVNNVETFAFMPWLLANSGSEFADIGTEKSTGTKLVSLDSSFNRPGIYEVDMGTPLRQVIDECGLGFKVECKGMQIGGPLGGIVPASEIDNLTVDFESFSNNGFLLGHASIVGIPKSMPIIDYIHHLFKFTADESCGKCFPCRLGATRGKEMFAWAKKDERKLNRQLLEDLLETMEIGSLCALGGGLPLPIKNALHYFSEELSQYFDHASNSTNQIEITEVHS